MMPDARGMDNPAAAIDFPTSRPSSVHSPKRSSRHSDFTRLNRARATAPDVPTQSATLRPVASHSLAVSSSARAAIISSSVARRTSQPSGSEAPKRSVIARQNASASDSSMRTPSEYSSGSASSNGFSSSRPPLTARHAATVTGSLLIQNASSSVLSGTSLTAHPSATSNETSCGSPEPSRHLYVFAGIVFTGASSFC